ncbi:hypothetical protein PsorP6_019609 [Peronosclerospora sorghi]|nr:hypothetical protein PsorP6_019609 [Peronosclerospora sorghi]
MVVVRLSMLMFSISNLTPPHSWLGWSSNAFITRSFSVRSRRALQSISPVICLITRLESPHMMTRPFSCDDRRARHRSRPRYFASLTVISGVKSEAAATIDHCGNFHTMAL